MSPLSRKLWITGLVLAVTGCAGGDPITPTPTPSQAEPTFGSAELAIAVDASQAKLGATTLPLVSGTLSVSAPTRDAIVLEKLEVRVGEITLPQTQLENMSLRDITVSLDRPTTGAAQWSPSGTGYTGIDTALLLDWSVVMPDGSVVPLATQRLDAVHFDLGVYTDVNGNLLADLDGGKEGSLGSWSGVGEMKDLAFDIHAEN